MLTQNISVGTLVLAFAVAAAMAAGIFALRRRRVARKITQGRRTFAMKEMGFMQSEKDILLKVQLQDKGDPPWPLVPSG